jgi:uncharacterized protein (DUF169 family)
MEEWISQGLEINNRIRPRTPPVAVKLLKDMREMPEGVMRPVKDFGGRMLICQAITVAREYGYTIGLTYEDTKGLCPGPILFGWGELEDETDIAKAWLEGKRFPDLETAKKTLDSLPRFEKGEYAGMIVSPIEKANLVPDVIVVYCNPAAVMVLIIASIYKRGGQLTFVTTGLCGCLNEIIRPILDGEPNAIIPGIGEKLHARTQDDEMAFSIPRERLSEIIEGFKCSRNIRYPIAITSLVTPIPLPIKVPAEVFPPYKTMSWK